MTPVGSIPRSGVTIIRGGEVREIDISDGRPIRITGNAFDINRVMEACKEQLDRIQSDRRDPHEVRTVAVPEREA